MKAKEKHLAAKEYLQRGRLIHSQIKRLYEKRLNYMDKATSITASLTPVKVQTSHSGQQMENAIIGMVVTQEEIENKIVEMQMMQQNLIQEIRRIHELPYEQMLYKVFIERKHPDEARKEINLTKWKGQYNRNFLLRDAIDAFAECHPEIFEQMDHSTE